MTHDRIAMAANLFAAFMFSMSVAATAQQNEEEILIESQALGSALQVLAEEYELQLLFESAVVTNLTAQAIPQGASSDAALDGLLEGTDLTYQFVNERTVAIREKEAAEESGEGKALPASNPVLMAQNRASAVGSRSSETSRTTDDDESEVLPLEEILVTGSRIRGAQSASPIVTITRQEIDRAGFATVEELVEVLPQNFGAGSTLDTNLDGANNNRNVVGGNVQNIGGGTSVNLRGLGASSTLVLLNGRRVSPSGFGARFTNISSIPVTAIERVEVLTDGASAIYGSDAIGGVINFIIRDDYEGAETRLRYGSDGRGDTSNVLLGQSFGKPWDDGNVLLTYEYYDSDNLANLDRDVTSTNDLTRFGGTDWRSPGGSPANIFAGNLNFAIPTGQDGTALTGADFTAVENGGPPLNLFNSRSVGDILPGVERHSAFLRLTQSIGSVDLFADAQFSTQETRSQGNFIANLVVNGDDPLTPEIEGNPFFVDPTGTGLTSVRINNYSFMNEIEPAQFIGEIESFGGTLGARFDIGERWSGELSGNWSKENSSTGIDRRLDFEALNAALNEADPNLAFNPFGDGTSNNPAVIQSFVDQTFRISDQAENELWSVNLNVDGEVFGTAGGAGRIASGIEYREESIVTDSFVEVPPRRSDLNRGVAAVYAELFFPLVSDSNSQPGFRRFELSIAGRYEDYSDFGDTFNPKVGLLWSPSKSVVVRGTWGTSFRAPALRDMDVSNLLVNSSFYFPQLFVDFGVVPFPLIVRVGGNEALQPEEATTWTLGFNWKPESIDGLSLDVTYFNVDFQNRIDQPTANIALADEPRFRSLLTSMPTLEQITAVVNDPRYDPDLLGIQFAAEDLASGVLPVDGIFDVRRANLAESVVTGVELQLAYGLETVYGSLNFGLNGNYLFDFERALIPGDPLIDEVDTYGRPVDLRVRGNVTWSREGWSVTGFINYVDGYTDNVSEPARSVDSWTTVDLSIAYEIGDNKGFLSDTRVALTTQNLFDEDPPFVNTLFGTAYDSSNASPIGRMLSLAITKEW